MPLLGRRSAPGAAEPANLWDFSWLMARISRFLSMNGLTPSSIKSWDVSVTNVFKSISFWMKFPVKSNEKSEQMYKKDNYFITATVSSSILH